MLVNVVYGQGVEEERALPIEEGYRFDTGYNEYVLVGGIELVKQRHVVFRPVRLNRSGPTKSLPDDPSGDPSDDPSRRKEAIVPAHRVVVGKERDLDVVLAEELNHLLRRIVASADGRIQVDNAPGLSIGHIGPYGLDSCDTHEGEHAQ